jgi:fatty acid/phospholipid biosynthesis enzyme
MKKKLAIDAMGGDFAPKSVVEGCLLARAEFPDTEFILFGDETKIRPLLSDETNITIVHTTEKIDSGEADPVKAIRRQIALRPVWTIWWRSPVGRSSPIFMSLNRFWRTSPNH